MKPTVEPALEPAPHQPVLAEAKARPVAEEPTSKPVRVYQPPAVLWEHPFVALAQTSACPIPGESECVP
jgi:hypothetical protein